jgi:hypothetical protein
MPLNRTGLPDCGTFSVAYPEGFGLFSCYRVSFRSEKLGIDPTLQAIALHLDPVPLLVCNLETRAFAGGPKNSPVSRWRRPDVYAGTL